MQSISDIIDTTLPLGFSYFYGFGDDEGYLRRMLHTNPSLEALYIQLKDDLDFISEADEDYFKNKRQLNAFKKLKKYLEEARKYIKTQLNKKKKGSKSEEEEIRSEIKQLDRDLRDGYIDQDEHDYAVKMLLKPSTDDLSEIKSKFQEIDQKAKREIKRFGYEEEDMEFTERDEEEYYEEFAVPRESTEFDIDKILKEKKYSPFSRIFHVILNDNADWLVMVKDIRNKIHKQWVKGPRSDAEMVQKELENLYLYEEIHTPDINKLVDDNDRRYTMGEFNDLYENMETVKEADEAQKLVQTQKLVTQYGPKNNAERVRKNNENLAFLKKVGVQVKNPKDMDSNQKLVDGYLGASQKK